MSDQPDLISESEGEQLLRESRETLEEWFATYDKDTPLFAEEVLGMEVDDFQREVWSAFDRGEEKISIRSGHGVGKSAALAVLVIKHLLFRYPQKTICTSSSEGQLFPNLANEVKIWIGKLPPEIQESLTVQTETVFLADDQVNSFVSYRVAKQDKPESIAGGHSPNMLIIIDEASGVHDNILETLIGSTTGERVCLIMAGNMVRNTGFFYDTHFKPDFKDAWYKIHQSCVTSKRVRRGFIDDVRRMYGERSNQYRVRVLGEPPLAEANAIIPWELCELALNRDVVPIKDAPIIWGLDVGRFGDDPSCLCKRQGNALFARTEEWYGLDTMQLVERLKDVFDVTPLHMRPGEINVDIIGMGAGVVDRAKQLKLPVQGINVSELPSEKDRFVNLRTELYFTIREWLEKRDCTFLGDEPLAKELVTVHYDFAGSTLEKIAAESKKAMRSRGIKSPNRADSFMLTFAGRAAISAGQGAHSRSDWSRPLAFKLRSMA